MNSKERLLAQIERAAIVIAPLAPLKSFIATNPLAGFESLPFLEAVQKGALLFGGKGLPSQSMAQQALDGEKICPQILKTILARHDQSQLFDEMVLTQPSSSYPPPLQLVDQILIKYLAAFLDEGQTAWEMPGRDEGFYAAWKSIAIYDSSLDKSFIHKLAKNPLDALIELLKDIEESKREELLQSHLAALYGWSGFIKWRSSQKNYPWQTAYPITLIEYLAVRLAICQMTEKTLFNPLDESFVDKKGLYWLEAWEQTYRKKLLETLRFEQYRETLTPNIEQPSSLTSYLTPQVQFIFCIDARCEVIRRHLEQTGPYETLGIAGFFGLPIRFTPFDGEKTVNSCPGLMEPRFEVTEIPTANHAHKADVYLKKTRIHRSLKKTFGELKTSVSSSFATVATTGLLVGISMVCKTGFPTYTQKILKKTSAWLAPKVKLEPLLHPCKTHAFGLSLEDQVFYATCALKHMGLTSRFAPLIVLCGHRSESVNNTYASSLDCGACGGNHGGPNARVMAAIFNDMNVRKELKNHGIEIPDQTLFVAAQYNTTTDEIELFDADIARHPDLKLNLKKAALKASDERQLQFTNSKDRFKRASDWAELRPEWGLARHAAFIVSHRDLTKEMNLEGRTFLHSYDWKIDSEGSSLESILTGSLLVCFNINMQYYFSSVDNQVYGSGSKTTHNLVSKIGVMQGRLGDLRRGFPWEAVMDEQNHFFHEPLRLTVLVQAPIERLTAIMEKHPHLKQLFDNEWLVLIALVPSTNKQMQYLKNGIWQQAC